MNHEDIAKYADDNTPYVSGKNVDKVAKFSEESSRVLLKWLVTIISKQIPANLCATRY